MSARRFKGYRVGIIKPDGARRYMKPRSDGKWSLSETKPIVLDEDEMSDALDDVGDFMVGGDVSFSTPVFATRKPKPAPAEGAVEGRYAVLFGDGSGGYFGVLDKRGNEVASRDVAAEGHCEGLGAGELLALGEPCELGGVGPDPLAAQAHHRALGLHQGGQLRFGQRRLAQVGFPAQFRQRVE